MALQECFTCGHQQDEVTMINKYDKYFCTKECFTAFYTSVNVRGANIEFQANETHLQWKYVNDTVWIDLCPLTEVGVLTPGPEGPQGTEGDTGEQGLKGDTGPQGPKGDQGDTGPQGIKGDTGADSTVPGPKGDTGDTGPQGTQGIQGIQGVKGDTGETGLQGLKGDTGDQGIQGIKGDKGDTGNQGIQGVKGDTGEQGIQGIQGIPGQNGSDASVTKSNVEAVLTGPITSHTHAYEPANSNIQTHVSSAHAPSNAVALSTVKADTDIASAISLKHSNSLDHASGSDNQDLSNLVVKETGKSLVADTEIAKIHANTLDHSHTNKSTLDSVQEALTTALKSGYDNAVIHAGTSHLQFSGLSKITVSTSEPSNPSVGDLWINSST